MYGSLVQNDKTMGDGDKRLPSCSLRSASYLQMSAWLPGYEGTAGRSGKTMVVPPSKTAKLSVCATELPALVGSSSMVELLLAGVVQVALQMIRRADATTLSLIRARPLSVELQKKLEIVCVLIFWKNDVN